MTRNNIENGISDYVEKALEKIAGHGPLDIDTFTSEMADLIKNLHYTYDYIGVVFEGPQGTRKTSLALLILYKIYGDWRSVLKSTYFTIPEFLDDSLSALRKKRRIMARLLDDFGFGEGSKWRLSSELADLLEYMNIIRTVYSALLFTYVDDSAAKFIRQNASIKIIMNRVSLTEVEAIIYKRKYTVMGPIWKRVLSFKFDKGVFNNIEGFRKAYDKYWEKRRKYAIEKGEKLKEGLDRKKQLLFATILGYYLGKYGYTFRDILGIMRDVMELRFKTKTAVAIHNLVKKTLKEYNIIEEGKRETKTVKRRKRGVSHEA